MATSIYQELSVATGTTGLAFEIPVESSVGVQVTPASGGSAYLQYSLYASPTSDRWITWIHGTVTATKSVDLSPSVRNVRLVSVSGAATAVISGRCV